MTTLSAADQTIAFELTPADNARLMNLHGYLDEHLRIIETTLGVSIQNRGHAYKLQGNEPQLSQACHLLETLYAATADKTLLTPNKVYLAIKGEPMSERVKLVAQDGVIQARSPNQEAYIEAILNHDINFGVGPAGTGKTYLAVACAVHAFKQGEINRIILVRPAVEAGERLGFLPGDLSQKVDPYLRPLYDALHDMFGVDKVNRLIEKQAIELAPLAYMRGRTLNDAYVILDESQNTTPEQMKMFLTRIGFGSTAVITGDITQIDLPRGVQSGLKHVLPIVKDVPGITTTYFDSKDIVRHPLVQRVIDAYDKHEQQGAP